MSWRTIVSGTIAFVVLTVTAQLIAPPLELVLAPSVAGAVVGVLYFLILPLTEYFEALFSQPGVYRSPSWYFQYSWFVTGLTGGSFALAARFMSSFLATLSIAEQRSYMAVVNGDLFPEPMRHIGVGAERAAALVIWGYIGMRVYARTSSRIPVALLFAAALYCVAFSFDGRAWTLVTFYTGWNEFCLCLIAMTVGATIGRVRHLRSRAMVEALAARIPPELRGRAGEILLALIWQNPTADKPNNP